MIAWIHFFSRRMSSLERGAKLTRNAPAARAWDGSESVVSKRACLALRLLGLTSTLLALFLLPLSVRAQSELWLERGLDQVRPFVAALHAISDRPISTLNLNGVPLHFLSTQSELPPALFLERARAHCSSPLEHFPLAIHTNQERRGLLICFDSSSTHSLPSRLEELLRSGDANALGVLRAVFAETSSSGGTVALTLTIPSLPFFSLFPAEGDSPGFDFPELPRPPGRRLLSLTRLDASNREEPVLTIYETPKPERDPLAPLLQFISSKSDWKLRSLPHKDPNDSNAKSEQSLLLQNRTETLLVLAQSNEEHTLTVVSRLPQ